MIISKKCKVCGIEKSISKYHKQKHGKYGVKTICKECTIPIQRKQRLLRGKEKHRIEMKLWREKNPEKFLETQRKSYRKNGKKQNERRKHRYHNDVEYRAKKQKSDKQYKQSEKYEVMRRKESNVLSARVRSREYKKQHPEQTRQYEKQYREKVWRDVERDERKELHDSYVIQVIKKQFDYSIKTRFQKM